MASQSIKLEPESWSSQAEFFHAVAFESLTDAWQLAVRPTMASQSIELEPESCTFQARLFPFGAVESIAHEEPRPCGPKPSQSSWQISVTRSWTRSALGESRQAAW